MWRGGINEETYRKLGFGRYGKFCQRCGAMPPKRLVVHHRNRDRSDNRVENLEPLCYSCHEREHADERRVARRFKKLRRGATTAPQSAA
jgi:hypothetical protein